MIGRKTGRRTRRRLLASRICTSLAAGFLLLAFAVAALGPPGWSLADAVRRLDGDVLAWLHRACPAAIWRQGMLPLLTRPAWVLPAMLGIVCSGLAITAARPLDLDPRRRR